MITIKAQLTAGTNKLISYPVLLVTVSPSNAALIIPLITISFVFLPLLVIMISETSYTALIIRVMTTSSCGVSLPLLVLILLET